jgi:hypothetical protein
MAVDRRFVYVGVFLFALGGVTLAAQGGIFGSDAAAQTLRLWPVAIIALGAGLLLHRTRFGLAGGLVAAAMPGLLLGGALVAAPRLVPECGGGAQPGSVITRQGAFDGPAAVDLTFACGDLSVSTAPGNAWQIQSGDTAGSTATVAVTPDRLSVASSGEWRAFGPMRGGDTWRLSLPTATSLDLAAEINAGRARLDLAGAQLANASLTVNAGDARVDLSGASVGHLSMHVNAAAASILLPASQDLGADLSVSAGSLKVCAPSGLGLRVHATTVLASANFGDLVRAGDAWESPGYAMANHHADVTIAAPVGSVEINPQGGCQ